MFGFFCAVSWAVLWAVYSVPASSGAFPCPRSVARPVGFYGASVGLPRVQWMKHTRKPLPPSCVASVQRPGLWVLLRPVCFYLWPCSMMGCGNTQRKRPPWPWPCPASP